MKKSLYIRVHPQARENKVVDQEVEFKDKPLLDVYVQAKPVQGQANQAVVLLLANFFQVKKTAITLVRGYKSKIKVVKVQT